MPQVTRQEIQGVQVLRYPDQSLYVEVAEHVRQIHQAQKSFSVERGEILPVRNVWIYRTWITVDNQTYIGDAEIHFGAPRDTPDGTNPISCGQTSALGNALAFAGFGDPSSTLERLGKDPINLEEGQTDPTCQSIEGIQVIWYKDRPYVPVVERLRHLHRAGVSLCMEEASIQEYQGVWIYRVILQVDGKRFVGDAEIFFDAPEGTFDHTYPVTCGQTSAVGAALGYAGFGDVRSLLQRQGKQVDGLLLPPTLASADTVLRAQQYGKAPQNTSQQIQQPQTAVAPRSPSFAQKSGPITQGQMEHIQQLCERLGESEPANLASMNQAQAEELERSLLAQEEELFAAADQVLNQPASSESTREEHQPAPEAESSGNRSHPESSPTKPQAQADLANSTEIGHLKKDWIKAFHISGYRAEVQQKWKDYKLRVCQVEVSDEHMTRAHYNLLRQDIAQQQTVPVQGGRRSQ